ncbi:MAG TPA: MFS transporter [Devosiaceae bacterium]
MTHVIKIFALLLGSALLMFGGGLQGLLLSVRGAQEGFPLYALGLIGTGWSVGFVAGSVLVPMLVRRVGHIRSYSVMATVGTVTILLNLLWVNDVGWIVLRVFSGFCFAGAAMIVESWLNEVADNKSRGMVFSTYTTINLVASTGGQMAMSVTGVAGYLPFVLGALSFAMAVLPTALTRSAQPRPLASARLDVGLLYRTSPVAVMASFAVGMANGTFGTLAPVFSIARGLDSSTIAYLMSVAVILGAVAQLPLGRISDFVDRRIVLIGASLAGALVGLLFLLSNPGGGWWAYLLFGAYGFAAYPIYAIAVAHANDFAKEGEFAKIASGMLLVYGIGLAIGPIVAAAAMNMIAPAAMFAVTTVVHLSLAGFAVLRMRMRPAKEDENREPFRPLAVGKAAPAASLVLDPRAEEEEEPLPSDDDTIVDEPEDGGEATPDDQPADGPDHAEGDNRNKGNME